MDSNTKKISLKFLLSNSLTGSLIGTQGKAIKELITITDAKINVSSASDFYPGTSERVILLSGTKEAVSLAQTLLWEMIGLMAKHAAENGGDTRLVEWNPRTAFESLGSNDSVEVTGKFSIPAAAGGVVLGKGGETLRGFSSQTSTRVTMSGKDEALFTQERIVTLSGTVGGCIACTDLILNKLHEVRPCRPPPRLQRYGLCTHPLLCFSIRSNRKSFPSSTAEQRIRRPSLQHWDCSARSLAPSVVLLEESPARSQSKQHHCQSQTPPSRCRSPTSSSATFLGDKAPRCARSSRCRARRSSSHLAASTPRGPPTES